MCVLCVMVHGGGLSHSLSASLGSRLSTSPLDGTWPLFSSRSASLGDFRNRYVVMKFRYVFIMYTGGGEFSTIYIIIATYINFVSMLSL